MTKDKTATLYRMVTPEHICPYGLKSKDLLERKGYMVSDNHLASRSETDAFKAKHGVETTPQTFINGKHIGGHDALMAYFGKAAPDPDAVSYRPVIAIFSMTFLMALMAAFVVTGQWLSIRSFEWFIAFSMCVLAVQKLQDIRSFSTMFLGYDVLAQKWVPYSYIYPFAEGVAGILMIGGVLNWFSIPLALFIASIGAFSVFKAVYIDKREIKCACVGGDSNVPLGFVSLTENIMMIAMAIWMMIKHF